MFYLNPKNEIVYDNLADKHPDLPSDLALDIHGDHFAIHSCKSYLSKASGETMHIGRYSQSKLYNVNIVVRSFQLEIRQLEVESKVRHYWIEDNKNVYMLKQIDFDVDENRSEGEQVIRLNKRSDLVLHENCGS